MSQSYFGQDTPRDHWTRIPESLTDEKIVEAAATLDIAVNEVNREQGVVHFTGTYDQEKALRDVLELWAREKI